MSPIDAIFIISVLLFSILFGLFLRCKTAIALTTFSLLLALAAIQFIMEGFYWQFIPAYTLVLACGMMAMPLKKVIERRKRAARVMVLGLCFVAAWTFLPVPGLTKPQGPYAVGTITYRWVDTNRAETATADPTDRRNVIVQAWYPIAPGIVGPHSTYIDGIEQLPQFVSLIPSIFMQHYDRVNTNSVSGAAISQNQTQWPVILFSPGYGAPRAFYTGLVSNLASRGYVVFAVDHPYEVAVTELADGAVATAIENFPADEADMLEYMSNQLDVRTDDLSFVLAQISRPGVLGEILSGHLDTDHIAAIGHSFGGAAAAAAMAKNSGIKAAVNIDGTLYGELPTKQLQYPFMLIESDHDETQHSEQFLVGNARLLQNAKGATCRYEIAQANHYSFTDAPLFLSLPARTALTWFIGGSRGPEETIRATTDILVAFLSEPLTGIQASVQDAVNSYENIHDSGLRND